MLAVVIGDGIKFCHWYLYNLADEYYSFVDVVIVLWGR